MADKKPTYWLDLFTGATWDEFLKAGGGVTGFRKNRWNAVRRIRPDDRLLCYLTGVSRFIGLLEVTSEPFEDHAPIWTSDPFPCRLRVRTLIQLTPDTAVPIFELRERLTIFQDLTSRNAWTGHVRGSPAKWKYGDGEVIREALEDAQANPVSRPVNPAKLGYRPRALKGRIGSVTVPGASIEQEEPEHQGEAAAPRPHTEIQYLLLKLGADLGLDVWVARNDRGRDYDGSPLASIAQLESLPVQFDEPTTKTIELIDVLWLKRNAIVAAFEIESTTSIYSGLLRMSDLIAMQPNLSIPLFLVAPEDRRNKVITEVNRPTFSRLAPPLVDMCRFISFESLREKLDEIGSVVKYLKPEFLDEIAESCEAEEG